MLIFIPNIDRPAPCMTNFRGRFVREAMAMVTIVVMRAAFFLYLSIQPCTAWLGRSTTIERVRCHHGAIGASPRKQRHLLSKPLPLHAVIPQSEPSALYPEQFDRNGNSVSFQNDSSYIDDTASSDKHQHDITQRQQLWLDLRDTALFPNEAIRFIHDQCCQNDAQHSNSNSDTKSKHLIDAVLVSSTTFDRIIASASSEANDSEDDEWYHHKLYYTTHDTTPEQIILHEPATQQSIPIGSVIYCSEKDKTALDVVALSEQIIKQHQWVLFQETTSTKTTSAPTASATKSVSNYMIKQLTDLMQFVSSSSNRIMLMMNMEENQYEVTESGLFLAPAMNRVMPTKESILPQQIIASNPTDDMSLDSLSSNDIDDSGLAIVCNDRTSFVMIDALLAEFRQLESIGTTTTTLSGITIPSTVTTLPNHNDNNNNNSNSTTGSRSIEQQQSQSSFVTALVLPLDVSIWETVYNNNALYTDDDDNNQ